MTTTPGTEIKACRICGSDSLREILDLGAQALASLFPSPEDPDPLPLPLHLLRCTDCGLVQLRLTVNPAEMYTYGYGYRSGTNATMRGQLAGIVDWIGERCSVAGGDLVLDIGCNDGTLLKDYTVPGLERFGIDPIVGKFADDYPPDITIHEGYFSTDTCSAVLGSKKAKVITSISIFYDLEKPNDFVAAIQSALAADGIWVLEQSYLPDMLETNAFDTICHEHLEYYALAQIQNLAERHGLRVFDVQLNDCNGGSFRTAVCHKDGPFKTNTDAIAALERRERDLKLDTDKPFVDFRRRIEDLRDATVDLVERETAAGKTFYLYGASTKGNTLLQYYGLDHRHIVAAAERNPEKWGRCTPLTRIPIVSEEDVRKAKPDYMLVLPWHFRREFVERETAYREAGGKMVFPLPQLEVV
jgi:NDP-4-keto-2,6-dideoxyhexose 3-C-methyltransferase